MKIIIITYLCMHCQSGPPIIQFSYSQRITLPTIRQKSMFPTVSYTSVRAITWDYRFQISKLLLESFCIGNFVIAHRPYGIQMSSRDETIEHIKGIFYSKQLCSDDGPFNGRKSLCVCLKFYMSVFETY